MRPKTEILCREKSVIPVPSCPKRITAAQSKNRTACSTTFGLCVQKKDAILTQARTTMGVDS